jgi:hypothetical protein
MLSHYEPLSISKMRVYLFIKLLIFFFATRGKDSKGITQYVDRRALTSAVKFMILTIPGITTPMEIPKHQGMTKTNLFASKNRY